MAGGRMGTPAFRGDKLPSDDHPRRTGEAKLREAQYRAVVARRLIRGCADLHDRVALLDMLGLLPKQWPRNSRGLAFVPVASVADWVARVDHTAWFRGTLVPCSGHMFRVKEADYADENPGGECPD